MKMIHVVAFATLVGTTGGVATAQAQTAFDAAHPRRAQVNSRLNNQNARITQGVRDGEISHAQAHRLRSDDRSIRAEERADASVDGSHITRSEQSRINAQENADSRAIYGARHY